jgi:hypothetical protein
MDSDVDMMVESFDSTESDDDRLLPLVGESFDALVCAPSLTPLRIPLLALLAPLVVLRCDVG